ncbi:heme exporter protein CcmD [Mesobacterium pallidum]|uniref:heme exporter protein CcmD n=1 Tax=Mesobacterium pallidum TaxID=2872037 RepID=UPI001EE1E9B3|nr:heme exporter protein CcmD [Mesobacterium pallidum]
MMPDLGKYADTVLSAYAASLVLLIALVWWSIRRAAKVKAELEDIEARRNGKT